MAWRSNSVYDKFIYFWTKKSFVAIIQILPQRMWKRTSLSRGYQVHFATNNFLSPLNSSLEIDLGFIRTRVNREKETLQIPVIAFDEYSFEYLSKIIVATSNTWVGGVAINDFRFKEFFDDEEEPMSAKERIDYFVSVASPEAQNLAIYCSVLPLTIGIIKEVQKIKNLEQDTTYIAEFYFGKLLKKSDTLGEFDFHDGVRELLRINLNATDAFELSEGLSDFMKESLGTSIGFNELLYENMEEVELSDKNRKLVDIFLDTFRRKGGRYLNRYRNITREMSERKIEYISSKKKHESKGRFLHFSEKINFIYKQLCKSDINMLVDYFSEPKVSGRRKIDRKKTIKLWLNKKNVIPHIFKLNEFSIGKIIFRGELLLPIEAFRFWSMEDFMLRIEEYKKYKPIKIFISYSSKDHHYKDEIKITLSKLERDEKIKLWVDEKNLRAGELFDEVIEKELDTSDMFLLLLSREFWASSYIQTHELPRILERHKNEKIPIVPIVLRDTYDLTGYDDVKNIGAIPRDDIGGKALKLIDDFESKDRAYNIILAEIIKRLPQSYKTTVYGGAKHKFVKVFVGHSYKDREIVNYIVNQLQVPQENFEICNDNKRDVIWQKRVYQAIIKAEFIALFLSESFLKSDFIQRVVLPLVHRQCYIRKCDVSLFLLEDCDFKKDELLNLFDIKPLESFAKLIEEASAMHIEMMKIDFSKMFLLYKVIQKYDRDKNQAVRLSDGSIIEFYEDDVLIEKWGLVAPKERVEEYAEVYKDSFDVEDRSFRFGLFQEGDLHGDITKLQHFFETLSNLYTIDITKELSPFFINQFSGLSSFIQKITDNKIVDIGMFDFNKDINENRGSIFFFLRFSLEGYSQSRLIGEVYSEIEKKFKISISEDNGQVYTKKAFAKTFKKALALLEKNKNINLRELISSTSILTSKRRKKITRLDKDRFVKELYQGIVKYFDEGLTQLKQHDNCIEIDITKVYEFKFIATVYFDGEIESQCEIWMDGIGGLDGIYYSIDNKYRDMSSDNLVYDRLLIEENNKKLYMKSSERRYPFQNQEIRNGKEAGVYFWTSFIQTFESQRRTQISIDTKQEFRDFVKAKQEGKEYVFSNQNELPSLDDSFKFMMNIQNKIEIEKNEPFLTKIINRLTDTEKKMMIQQLVKDLIQNDESYTSIYEDIIHKKYSNKEVHVDLNLISNIAISLLISKISNDIEKK